MASTAIQQALDLALQHHQAGRLGDAERMYRQILAHQPDHADALHLLGVAASQAGRPDAAIELMQRAIALNPRWPEAHYNLANVLADRGLLDEAIAAYHRAIALKPTVAPAHSNLGNALTRKGRLDEAIDAYRHAIAIKPDYAEAYSNLGNALREKGQMNDAIAACRRAIALRADFPEAQFNLGNALLGKGLLDEAIAAFRRAVALKPDYPHVCTNLGNALKEKGQFDEAIAAYRQAIALNPGLHESWCNLGTALKDKGQFDEAIAAYRQAIALKPDFDDAHYNLALVLLLQGDFSRGWAEYEWRWRTREFISARPIFSQPQWDGSDLNGRTLFLCAEQGFGDSIQFIRYVPLVAARCGRIVVACPPQLQRLFRSVAGVAQWVVSNEAQPPFDFHCPLLSVPRVLGATLEALLGSVPYLKADPGEIERWRQRLAHDRTPLKVGLAWAGRSTHTNDRRRSIALSVLTPLGEAPGISFYSLQKGQGDRPAGARPDELKLIDVADELHDFADTAALIANLDLVITVDTAVAHLAGAMGKAVWTLLPFVPDWRWLLERRDSPWYPTMRLFRQPSNGDWQSVIREVVDALRSLENRA